MKATITNIILERAEGQMPLPKPIIITTDSIITTEDRRIVWGLKGTPSELAHLTLSRWGITAPHQGQGYDKCDFVVEWSDGSEYKGRFDLQYGGRNSSGQNLMEQVKAHLESMTGQHKPNHMTQAQYDLLCRDPRAKAKAQEMLDTLELP